MHTSFFSGEIDEHGVHKRGSKTTTETDILHEVTMGHYYATEYNSTKDQLTWLKERETALQEYRQSIIAGCSEACLQTLKPPLPLNYVRKPYEVPRRDPALTQCS